MHKLDKLDNKLLIIATLESARLLSSVLCASDITCQQFSFVDIIPVPINNNTNEVLQNSDIVIFNSANAINHFLPYLKKDVNLRKVKVFTMGSMTAQLLQEKFSQVFYPQSGNDSEALLKEFDRQSIVLAKSKIAIIKGEGGREFLANRLRELGAKVELINVYKRFTDVDKAPELLEILKKTRIKALVFMSTENIKIFSQAVNQGAVVESIKTAIYNLPVFVQHCKIYNKALEYGFNNVVFAQNITAMSQEILATFDKKVEF